MISRKTFIQTWKDLEYNMDHPELFNFEDLQKELPSGEYKMHTSDVKDILENAGVLGIDPISACVKIRDYAILNWDNLSDDKIIFITVTITHQISIILAERKYGKGAGKLMMDFISTRMGFTDE